VLPALVFAALIGIARLRIWTIAPGSRRMTLGMLAIIVSAILFTRRLGEDIIDPLMIFGANTSDLGQHLFTVAACYEFGALALETGRRERWLTRWRIFIASIGIALATTYRISRQYTDPSDEFTLGGAPARAHQWLLLATLTATFLMVLLSSIKGMPIGGTGGTQSLIFMALAGIVGVGSNIVVAALMIADPSVVASSYHSLARVCTIAVLIFLGLAGMFGLASAWARRHDPRP
jgi:hypothetical protein